MSATTTPISAPQIQTGQFGRGQRNLVIDAAESSDSEKQKLALKRIKFIDSLPRILQLDIADRRAFLRNFEARDDRNFPEKLAFHEPKEVSDYIDDLINFALKVEGKDASLEKQIGKLIEITAKHNKKGIQQNLELMRKKL